CPWTHKPTRPDNFTTPTARDSARPRRVLSAVRRGGRAPGRSRVRLVARPARSRTPVRGPANDLRCRALAVARAARGSAALPQAPRGGQPTARLGGARSAAQREVLVPALLVPVYARPVPRRPYQYPARQY